MDGNSLTYSVTQKPTCVCFSKHASRSRGRNATTTLVAGTRLPNYHTIMVLCVSVCVIFVCFVRVRNTYTYTYIFSRALFPRAPPGTEMIMGWRAPPPPMHMHLKIVCVRTSVEALRLLSMQ